MIAMAGLIILLGMSFVAMTAIIQRYLVKERLASDGQILVWQMGGCSLILLVGSLLWEVSTPGTASSQMFWTAVVATTIANILFQLGTVKTRAAEVSLTAPILALSPGLVTISVIFLGEIPTTQGIVGILLMMFGAWMLGAQEVPLRQDGTRTLGDYARHYIRPFRMLVMPKDASPEIAKKVVALRWAYAVACAGAVGLIFDGLLARNGNFLIGHGIQFGALAGLFFIMKRKDLGFKTENVAKLRFLKILPFMGLIYGMHIFFVAEAYRFAPIAYVGAMKRILIILTILFGWWLLQEKQAKWCLIPGAIITGGAVLLAFDPSSQVIMDAGQQLFGE